MTHDYKRNGTTTLFAAFDVLEGRVIGRCMQRHRHQEFIRFLNAIERELPLGKLVHVILDNYAAHKHPKVIEWLGRHPRFTFHFTPTSASWVNAVEGFFAKLTKQRLKRGVFHSLVSLQEAINRYVADRQHRSTPLPMDQGPGQDHRRGAPRAPSVGFAPLDRPDVGNCASRADVHSALCRTWMTAFDTQVAQTRLLADCSSKSAAFGRIGWLEPNYPPVSGRRSDPRCRCWCSPVL